MSMTKRSLPEDFHREPDLKFIDDTYRYWQWQKQQDRMLKENPLSDCCNAPVNHIETNGGSVSICSQCKEFCKIH